MLRSAVLATALSMFAGPAALAADTASPTSLQAEARELFARLIAFRTEAGAGQVPAMVDFLVEQLRGAGFTDTDIHVLPLGDTASLVVRYRGDGSGGRPVLLMAHMDVVAAKRDDWQRDPYQLVEHDGYFYGRGTIDVKDGVAALTHTFIRLKREGFRPRRDLLLVFSGDEETEMLTAQDLATRHRELIDAEFALNSDGGGGELDEHGRGRSFSIQTAEKTYASFEITARNAGGHSSLPRTDNAIFDLADAIKKVQAHRFAVMWNDTTRTAFRMNAAVTPGELGEAMRRFAADPNDEWAADRLAANPSTVGATRTTCVPTLLQGGHADNALPQSATLTVNCRIFPGVPVDRVRAELQQLVGDAIDVKGIGTPTASDASPLREDVVVAVTRAVHARHPGIPIVPLQESGASDGLYFRAAGIPTYGVGGAFIRADEMFAHGLDERIPVQSFYDELDYWYRLVIDIAD